MTKKALSALSFFAGATQRKQPSWHVALALLSVWSQLRLEESSQQTSAPAGLVRALDYRGLYSQTTRYSQRAQSFYAQTCHRILAPTSSTQAAGTFGSSLSHFRWNLPRATQRSVCGYGC